MAPAFRYPDKPRRGDAVAVLSPSAGLPARFPLPYELGLTRLREEFGLRPVEYPSTRAAQASPARRAADIHAALVDPEIKAIIASIGGEDELKVLAHLDPDVLRARPKPFFGYSDNTNLHLLLWTLGLVSYLGGSVMVQFGRPVAMHPVSRQSLERALFTRGSYRLEPPDRYCDQEGDWADPATLAAEPASFPAAGGPGTARRSGCPARPGAGTSRSSTSTCGPGGTCVPTTATRAPCCSWRRRRNSPPPATCTGC